MEYKPGYTRKTNGEIVDKVQEIINDSQSYKELLHNLGGWQKELVQEIIES